MNFKEITEAIVDSNVRTPIGEFPRVEIYKGSAEVRLTFASDEYDGVRLSYYRVTPENKQFLEDFMKEFRIRDPKKITPAKAIEILKATGEADYYVDRMISSTKTLTAGKIVLGIFDKIRKTKPKDQFKRWEDVVVQEITKGVKYEYGLDTKSIEIREGRTSQSVRFKYCTEYQRYRAAALKQYNTIDSGKSDFTIYNYVKARGFDWDYVLRKLSKFKAEELVTFLNAEFAKGKQMTNRELRI